jgi:hypothetical protein
MARFKGTVQGSRGEASRLGHKTTGLIATLNGWDVGIEIQASVNNADEDVFHIYRTSGSNNSSRKTLLCELNTNASKLNDLISGVHFE